MKDHADGFCHSFRRQGDNSVPQKESGEVYIELLRGGNMVSSPFQYRFFLHNTSSLSR